ncbi:MAG: SurA N-terminal domain-containing protein [Treponema sp.]|nr:SurA N-terminal domain-containing protein [Treponema sp.]
MKNKRFLIFSIFCMAAPVAGFSQYNGKAVVATIQYNTTEPVTAEQLRLQVEILEKQAGRTATTQERQQVLDGMIDQKLVIQASAKEKITVSETEINQQIQVIKQQMAQSAGRMLTDAEFAEAIKQQTGMDMSVYRDQMRQQMLINKYITQRYLPQVVSKANLAVGDNEINEQIQNMKNQMAASLGGRQPTDAEFSAAVKQQTGLELAAFRAQLKTQTAQQKYILRLGGGEPTNDDVSTELRAHPALYRQDGYVQGNYIRIPFTAATKTRAKDTADKLMRQIGSSGEEFLFHFTQIKNNSDPQNYQNCFAGSDYFVQSITLQRMGKEFFDVAFPSGGPDNQGIRKVSKLVETPQEYVILYILKREKGKDLALNDIVPEYLGMGAISVKDYIASALLQDRINAGTTELSKNLISELRKAATIKTFPQYINW